MCLHFIVFTLQTSAKLKDADKSSMQLVSEPLWVRLLKDQSSAHALQHFGLRSCAIVWMQDNLQVFSYTTRGFPGPTHCKICEWEQFETGSRSLLWVSFSESSPQDGAQDVTRWTLKILLFCRKYLQIPTPISNNLYFAQTHI